MRHWKKGGFWITADTREKPTANRRESALRARKIGFAYPHFRNPASLSCSSLIGSVRANPVAAPAAPNGDFLLRLILRWSVKEHFSYSGLLDESLPHGSRWGGDRICPNAPDEGTSRWVERVVDEVDDLSRARLCLATRPNERE